MNKNKSKITPILRQLADLYGREFCVMDHDLDAGYIVGLDGIRHYFSYGTLDLNNNAATEFSGSKILSSEIVSTAGIRVPKEETVSNSNNVKDGIRIALKTVGVPAIIKPVHGAQGKNVFRIDSIDELDLILGDNDFDADDVIVQEYIDAPTEIRVVLLDGEIIQAYKRDYSHIIGDGVTTIKGLIEKRNKSFQDRKRNTCIDLIDSQLTVILKRHKYDLGFVLPKDERLNISYGRNLSRGGEYEFIPNRLSSTVEKVSKKIANVSALRLVGIDLFILGDVESIDREDQIVFIEYNASPDMENNFYYDTDYSEQLLAIYEKIFTKLIN
mgnify:CR=1 FL=1